LVNIKTSWLINRVYFAKSSKSGICPWTGAHHGREGEWHW